MKNKLFLSVLYNSSIIFTVLCLLSTLFWTVLFWGDDGTNLPSIGFNFALLAISCVIALFIALLLFKLKKPYLCEKINFIYFLATLFTYLFLFINLSTVAFKNIWSGVTILSIFLVSIFASLIKFLLKIPFAVKATLNFILFAIPYFSISVVLGNFGEGNKIIILIFVYLLVFTAATTVIAVIRSVISKQQSNQEVYSKMFK